ncbi:hypothetical protein GCM10023143_18170 [Compostibacter hankyongensis]|uniref:HTH luxR-type domain-containing protein n=2 Tax=Compostibacter hankyongensis TaxID=1007089 RepID=A0ABP8FSG7_9BACT
MSWCNNFMEKRTGYTLVEMQQMGNDFFTSVLHPDDFIRLLKIREEFRKGQKESSGICRIKGRNDRQWHWLYGTAVPYAHDKDGLTRQVISILHLLKQMETLPQMAERLYLLIQSSLSNQLNKLTSREKKVLKLVSSDKSDEIVARDLFIEKTTLKTHKKHIREKLGSENFELLVALAHASEAKKISEEK